MEEILGKSFDTVSRWWGRNGTGDKGRNIEEIDIVAYSETRRELLFAECMRNNIPLSANAVENHESKSETL